MRIPSDIILELADRHLERLARMVEADNAGVPGYRVADLREMQGVWQSVKDKGGMWSALSGQEMGAVLEAVSEAGLRIDPPGAFDRTDPH